jgi:hypothetical protein
MCKLTQKSTFSSFIRASEEPDQWVDFIFSGNAPVCAKHLTDDCFLNLGQYRAGLAERLKMKCGFSVQLVTALTGDHQTNASLVIVATAAVGNRGKTRSCPCEFLFYFFL